MVVIIHWLPFNTSSLWLQAKRHGYTSWRGACVELWLKNLKSSGNSKVDEYTFMIFYSFAFALDFIALLNYFTYFGWINHSQAKKHSKIHIDQSCTQTQSGEGSSDLESVLTTQPWEQVREITSWTPTFCGKAVTQQTNVCMWLTSISK